MSNKEGRTTESNQNVWEEFAGLEEQNWITQSVKGRGDIKFNGCLRFAGSWTGSVYSSDPEAHIYLLRGSKITGSIQVPYVTIEGTVEDGCIEAKSLYAKKEARVFGKIKVEKLVLDEGAVVEGQISQVAHKQRFQ